MESAYVSKNNHFWVLRKPQVEKKDRENVMSCAIPSSVVQNKLRWAIFVWDWRNFLTYVLDGVASLEEFLFLTFNILLC